MDEGISSAEKTNLVSHLAWWYSQLRKSKIAVVGVIILLLTTVVAVGTPFIAPHEPTRAHLQNRFQPPVWAEEGTWEFPLGTDQLGRCMLSRLLYGTQISLIVGVLATCLGAALGIVMGVFSAYFGGFIDTVIMRLADTLIVIPNIVLYIVVMGVFGTGLWILILVLGVFRWSRFARVIRSEVLSVKEREYVEAARALGQSQGMIMFRHILPNVMASAIVLGTLNIATTIVSESGLSFLGLGVPPPAVSWGRMLADGRDYLSAAYWIATFPGIAITTVVLGITFIGDWLRDVLDPRLKQ